MGSMLLKRRGEQHKPRRMVVSTPALKRTLWLHMRLHRQKEWDANQIWNMDDDDGNAGDDQTFGGDGGGASADDGDDDDEATVVAAMAEDLGLEDDL